MAGRKPKPTSLKLLHGNPGKRKLPDTEPKPSKADITPPEGLSKIALQQWHIVAKQLIDAGILTVLDIHALALYCESFALWKQANDGLAAEGLTVTNPQSGLIKAHPLVTVSSAALGQMMKILSEFGMTPSSRSKVKVTPEGDLDPLERLLNRD